MTGIRAQFKPRVIHIFRLPKGGVFRHVSDLVRAQSEHGMSVGLICDLSSDDNFADRELAELAEYCELGVHRFPIARTLSLADKTVINEVKDLCRKYSPEILHGHGAKGGAYARLIAKKVDAKAIYTPHGGSLHYAATSPAGVFYLGLEKILKSRTDGLIFESHYSAGVYESKLGRFPCDRRVIHNGLRPREFNCWTPENAEYDFLFIGELRKLKGLDTLLEASAQLAETRKLRVLVAGAGPDKAHFEKRHAQLHLDQVVDFSPPVFPARSAFNKARCVVIPSLAESFPYIVLEALAAGVPVLATNVGGIPEIFEGFADSLLPAGNVCALARGMQNSLYEYEETLEKTREIQQYVQRSFSLESMNSEIINYYANVLDVT